MTPMILFLNTPTKKNCHRKPNQPQNCQILNVCTLELAIAIDQGWLKSAILGAFSYKDLFYLGLESRGPDWTEISILESFKALLH